MFKKETIAAVATGLTDSGIGIIRISGENAIRIGDSLFRSPSGRCMLESAISHMMYYGYVVKYFTEWNFQSSKEEDENGSERKGGNNWKRFIIDEVMAVVMRAPKSFTGEDTVEIHCHGGVFVMQKILSETIMAGARLAEPGEFTKRAFLNGKIDLTRAEAVMDVIHSQNESALAASVNHLRGSLYQKIKSMRSDIIYEIAFIESALDDPEHISLEGYQERLSIKICDLLQKVEKLISTADNGRLIREGIQTVIIGKPNVGKSSLMNLLIGEDRAIVTDVAGTTRDVLKESVRLNDISFCIVDTAGIHDTEDEVEKIGVEKAKKYAKNADLILYVMDASLPLDERDREILSILENKKFIVLLNKSDLVSVLKKEDIKDLFRDFATEEKDFFVLRTSAKNGEGITEFEEIVKNLFFQGQIRTDQEVMITNIRHKEALQEALEALRFVKKSVEDEMPEDFYSVDLMNAYSALGRIIGEEVGDDLVEEIFSRFCMGK